MTSTRPYLIRAFYDWIVDNNCTPHVVINAEYRDVEVPREFVEDGQIVLNIAMSAVNALTLGDFAIEFQARFGGKVRKISAPPASILAIYAKENGRGMVFAEEEEEPSLPPPTDTKGGDKSGDKGKGGKGGTGKGKRPPHLTVVK